jgi:hypothetical protein
LGSKTTSRGSTTEAADAVKANANAIATTPDFMAAIPNVRALPHQIVWILTAVDLVSSILVDGWTRPDVKEALDGKSSNGEKLEA